MVLRLFVGSCLFSLLMTSCGKKKIENHQSEMVEILKKVRATSEIADNALYPKAGLVYVDSILQVEKNPDQVNYYRFMRGKLLLAMGNEEKAIEQLEAFLENDREKFAMLPAWKELAIAYLRLGERSNCISNHAAESCIIPIKGMGIHSNQSGSSKAVDVYKKILQKNPSDLESRWLLNLAYMTLGEYPQGVPASMLIPNMGGDTTYKVYPFTDIAADLKLNVNNLSGGSIVEDFDNDGYLDIMATSGWDAEGSLHYFKNNADGTFTELTDKIGLHGITGGLNMMQTDYNNDGFMDVFITRGGWKRDFGKEPNSLLRNNGNGTFTDVTIESGLLSYHPTQTATWNDFNNDGWVDVFIGNETYASRKEVHPCEFFINNQDGTFTEMAKKANCQIIKYVKGVTSGDFDHDGWKDIFISTVSNQRILLKNNGTGEVSFTDVTSKAKLDHEQGNTFPTWFWDFDNDGWLDIFACDYTYKETLGVYEASEKLNIIAGNPEKMLLYKNNHDGTFTNVANQVGLTTNVFAMGSNFGDIDNDGFLDMYLGTGNPDYKSVVPNKMFRNSGGIRFNDVTASARVGHLQKGHGVSFADMDNDGDQDIYIEMGGVFPGDTYQNSFFLNPGQGNNNWICLKLEGVKSNKAAIGTQLKLTFHEKGIVRSVYRDVNSGGSFGSSPFRREIGIGQATLIDEIEIRWHGSNEVQTFKNIKPNQFLKITEGNNSIETVSLKKITWTLPDKLCLPGEQKLIAKK